MVSITSSVSSDFGNKMYVDGPGGGGLLEQLAPTVSCRPGPREHRRAAQSPVHRMEPHARAQGRKALDGLRDTRRRPHLAVAASVLLELRRLRDERAASATRQFL